MRKIIKSILAIFIFTNILLHIPFNHVEDEHNHELFHVAHVYAWGPGDTYGICSNCPAGTMTVMDAFNPDCTNAGRLFVMCSNCGYGTDIYLAALGHDYSSSITRNPTCTEAGIRTYSCSRCSSSYNETISATGHSYVTSITKEATCLEAGTQVSRCSRCNDSNTSTIAPLGHDYVTTTTKAATCTQTGTQTTRCNRCGDSSSKTIKALGHDYEVITKEATCTQDGLITKDCKRCHDHSEEIIKALSHDLDDKKVIKEATCTEDGIESAICKRCNENIETKIVKLGHDFAKDWTIEKEASYFSQGLQTKKCSRCDEKQEELIPKKSLTPIILTTGLVGMGATGLFMGLRKANLFKRMAKEVIEEPKDLFKPSIEDKTALLCSVDEEIYDYLKDKHYLEVSTCEYDSLSETISENEPDISIIKINSDEQLNEILSIKQDTLADYNIALLIDKTIIDNNLDLLNEAVKNKTIINYLSSNTNNYQIMTKMILPILKPNFKSDETLENIGSIADILGIPGISDVLNIYISGRDIKNTLQEGELGITEKATIISDIAYILGFDQVGDVVNLVNNVNDIKTSLDKESGVYEVKEGVKAGKDIVDVISDIVDN